MAWAPGQTQTAGRAWPPLRPAALRPRSHADVFLWLLAAVLTLPGVHLAFVDPYLHFISWPALVSYSPVSVLSLGPQGQHLSLAGRLAASPAGTPAAFRATV